ncbi:calcium-binding protein [Roseovarius sp. S1116L3]|uniref:calcium-binding protein n=1 Tax=Roseovarius roseus TaxID=3342636 RepID=UPI003729CFD4
MATPINPGTEQDWDQPLNTDPLYRTTHVFSTKDIVGTFDGLTQGDVQEGDAPVIDFSSDPKVTKEGVDLFPINSEFGWNVTDFSGATEKEFSDGLFEEGWAGDLFGEGGDQIGLVVSDAPTDTYKTPAVLGTWLSGIGGNTVKASTEHYSVMQNVLSDQKFPEDPDAVYGLDDDLILLSQNEAWNGVKVAELLSDPEGYGVIDKNDDGVFDLSDLLNPNETTIEYDIAYGEDYSVTMKDDGKLLYRWGNTVKRPNDIRIDAELEAPDEWSTPDDNGLLPLFRVTSAELVLHHTITNNPNDQVRPEGLENEAAIGTLPSYEELPDGTWVSTADFYAGDGTLYPAGTVLKDPSIPSTVEGTMIDQIGATSVDLEEGFTNAWYTTQDREPFEPVLNEDGEYVVGPRWRLQADKYGQDLPSVVIPTDPSDPLPTTQDEEKYEVGAETQTVLNLLDWETAVSPLSISAGWQNLAGTAAEGLELTGNLDFSFYVKGDTKPATLYSAELLMDYEEIQILAEGASFIGGAEDDYIAGQGNNTLTGGAGSDFFILSYGDSVDSGTIQSNTISDFEVGFDMLGLIGLGADNVTLDTVMSQTNITQTVDGDDLVISVGGYQIAVLEGVAEALGAESFMTATQSVTEGPVEIIGTEGDDDLEGTEGADSIDALGGNDKVLGLGGSDTIYGGEGEDTINGGSEDDFIFAEADNDTVYAGVGDDSVDGGTGDDAIYGMEGNDSLLGGAGNDTIAGQDGDDVLTGNSGSDVMFGGEGEDFLNGGYGNDRLNGGTEADTFFHLGAAGHGTDWVQDYNAAEDDILFFGNAAASASDFVVNSGNSGSGDGAINEAFVVYQGAVIWALVDGMGQDEINLRIAGSEDVFDLLA